MKLIDILVQELPKRGGWPEDVEEVWQDYNRLMRPLGWFHDELCDDHRRQHHDADVKINRKQYEAALAASKPEWDGEGLPPVGAEVECVCNELPNELKEKLLGHILYSGEYTILKTYKTNNQHHVPVESVFKTKSWTIIPIRSEADKKRDEAIESIKAMLMYDYGDDPRLNDAVILYDAIAAGKIPHIRID